MALAVVVLCTAAMGQPTVGSDAAHQQFVFAYRLFQTGEDQLASQAFDDYLGRFPTDEKRGDALYFRALIAQRSGRNQDAARFLQNIPVTKLVQNHAVLLLTGQVHYDLGRHDQALAALEQIRVDTLDPAVKASVYYLRGSTYRATNNLAAAEAQLRQAVELDTPLRPRGLLDLARVQALQGRREQAIATLEQCLSLGNTDAAAEAARLAGDLAYQSEHYPQAIGFYQIVMTRFTSSPHMGPAVLGVMWSHFQGRNYEQTLATFEQYRESFGDAANRAAAWYLAGSAFQEMNQHDNAVALFTQILSVPGSGAAGGMEDKALYKLAASQFELGQYDAMAQTVGRLRAQHPNSPRLADADFLLAASAARRGDAAGGSAQLGGIINAGPEHPYFGQALLQRAKLYDENRAFEQSAADYRQFLTHAQTEQGAQRIDRDTMFDATLRLIDLYYRAGQADRAEAEAAKLLQRGDLTPLVEVEAMYRRALAQIRLQQYQAAHDTFSRLLAKHPTNQFEAQVYYYRGLLLLSMNKGDEAVSDLRVASESPRLEEPLKINALRLMAARLREQGNVESAAGVLLMLEKLVTVRRLRVDEQLWLARYYTDRTQPRNALVYLEPVLGGGEEISGAARAEGLLLAARGLRDLNDPVAATNAFREVVSIDHGFGMRARLELARTLLQTGKIDEAIIEYEGLTSTEEPAIAADALFDSAQIYRDVSRRRKRDGDAAGSAKAREQARVLLLKLVLLYSHPELSPIPELGHIELAEIAVEDAKPETAVKYLQDLAEKFPDGAYANYAKAVTRVVQDKREEARFLLRRLQEQERILDPRLQRRVAAQLQAMEARP